MEGSAPLNLSFKFANYDQQVSCVFTVDQGWTVARVKQELLQKHWPAGLEK